MEKITLKEEKCDCGYNIPRGYGYYSYGTSIICPCCGKINRKEQNGIKMSKSYIKKAEHPDRCGKFSTNKEENDILTEAYKKGIAEGRSQLKGDLLKKSNHILGCMLECYCNILDVRGFNKEAIQLGEIASKIK